MKPNTEKPNNDINKTTTAAVRITDSCLIRGMHLEARCIYEMSETDANDIFTARRGEVIRVRPSKSAPAMPVILEAA